MGALDLGPTPFEYCVATLITFLILLDLLRDRAIETLQRNASMIACVLLSNMEIRGRRPLVEDGRWEGMVATRMEGVSHSYNLLARTQMRKPFDLAASKYILLWGQEKHIEIESISKYYRFSDRANSSPM